MMNQVQANLIDDYYDYGGIDDYDMFAEFCRNYREDDYRHSVPILTHRREVALNMN